MLKVLLSIGAYCTLVLLLGYAFAMLASREHRECEFDDDER